MAASQAFQFLRLHRAFDSFSDDAGLERPGQRQDAFNDRGTLGKQDASDERTIVFQGIDRMLVLVAQR